MIRSFLHKGLIELYHTGHSGKVRQDLVKRVQQRLEILHQARNLGDIQSHGFNFHALHGTPKRYSVHVNGPWCITFEWVDNEAWRVDLEQYH